jgi:hypothetical protein
MPKERAGTRNVYIYPEKQTPIERLTARVVSAIGPYIDEDIEDDKFDELSLEIKAIGRRYIREVKQELQE